MLDEIFIKYKIEEEDINEYLSDKDNLKNQELI